jgi:DNA-directed RNA polymerase specialized sigma24 family protein
MAIPDSHEVTELLLAWSEGDQDALDRLMPLVYEELRRLAQSYMRRERAGHTLQTTALIHEAYLRLIDAKQTVWKIALTSSPSHHG